MKKLLINSTAFITIVAMLAVVVTIVLKSIDSNYGEYTRKIRSLQEKSQIIEALAVGSSHSIGLDFDELHVSGYHIWQYNGDVFEVDYQLRSLVDGLPNLRVVYFPISYFTFYWDNSVAGVTDRNFIRREMYRAIDGDGFIDGDCKSWLAGKILPIDDWKKSLILTLKPHKRNYLDRFGRPIFVDKTRFSTEESMVKNAVIDSIPYHVGHQDQMLRGDKTITVRVKQQILLTIDYLHSKNIEVIFFTPPYYKAYTDNYPKEYVDTTNKIMREIVVAKNVKYFDFSKHLEFTDDHRYFYDSHHLNADGSRIFSQALFAKLNH